MDLPKGLKVWENKKNGFTIVMLHYSADPEKGEDWVNSIKQNMASDQWDQEFEIDWDVYTGKAFFPSFKTIDHVKNLVPVKERTILRGWDFGYHYPAVVFCQKDDQDRLLIVDEYHEPDVELDIFAQNLIQYSTAKYPGFVFKDYCDPAGKQVSDKGPLTSIEILYKYGITPDYRRVPEDYGWGIIRQQLLIRKDGYPGLFVDPKCQYIIKGFEGEMHYPNYRDGQRIKEAPVEKHPVIDHFDSLKYLGVGVYDIGNQEARNQDRYIEDYQPQPNGSSTWMGD